MSILGPSSESSTHTSTCLLARSTVIYNRNFSQHGYNLSLDCHYSSSSPEFPFQELRPPPIQFTWVKTIGASMILSVSHSPTSNPLTSAIFSLFMYSQTILSTHTHYFQPNSSCLAWTGQQAPMWFSCFHLAV